MSFRFDCSFHSIEARFGLRVAWLDLKSLFVGFLGADWSKSACMRALTISSFFRKSRLTQVGFSMQSSCRPVPAFGPIGFEFCRLFTIFEGMVKIFQRSISSGSIGVEHMVCRVELDRLGEFLTARLSISNAPFEVAWITYIDSSNFFSAKSLLPSALRASAIARALVRFSRCAACD